METNPGGLAPDLLIALSSLLMGTAAFLLGWALTSVLTADRGDGLRWGPFETGRRRELRSASRLYRWFEPVVDDLADRLSARRPSLLQRIERALTPQTDEPPWTAAEWLAVSRLNAGIWAIGLGLPLGYWCWTQLHWRILGVGLPLAICATAIRNPLSQLEERARRVRSQVRCLLPFAIDLMQLMLKAGASFTEAIETLVRQTQGSSLSHHLDVLLREIERGTTRSEALANFQARLGMEEINDLVFALRQGDELGTPLTQILESQAYQSRHRQAQAIERAAEQAKVKFTGPCTVIMVACMIAMLGPWLLKVFHDLQAMSFSEFQSIAR
jgi:tight adherence protein C